MHRGRLKHEWHLASHLLAAIYNSQQGRTKEVHPHQLNPMYERPPVSLDDILGLD